MPSLAADAALGLYGWRGMSEALRDRLAAEATAIMAKPAAQASLRTVRLLLRPGGPNAFAQAISTKRGRKQLCGSLPQAARLAERGYRLDPAPLVVF